MKKLLTLALICAGLSLKAQSNLKTRYFIAEIKYTTNKCSGHSTQSISGKSTVSFDEIRNSFKRWIYPQRIVSFEITSLKEVSKKEHGNPKTVKFECYEIPKFQNCIL